MGTMLLLAVLFVLGLSYVNGAGLYGIIPTIGGVNTQTIVLSVSIDPPTAKFTSVTECFVYIGSSAMYDGISDYDQKNNYFWYASNFDSDFVYGVDILKKEILPPISIGSQSVLAIDWDGTNNQLLITGTYKDKSQLTYTYPYAATSPSVPLLNYTANGIGPLSATYLNWKTGTFYFTFLKGTDYYLGSYALTAPKAITQTKLGCTIAPDFLFADASGNMFGIGVESSMPLFLVLALAYRFAFPLSSNESFTYKRLWNITAVYKYFSIKGAACTVTDIGLTGVSTKTGHTTIVSDSQRL